MALWDYVGVEFWECEIVGLWDCSAPVVLWGCGTVGLPDCGDMALPQCPQPPHLCVTFATSDVVPSTLQTSLAWERLIISMPAPASEGR